MYSVKDDTCSEARMIRLRTLSPVTSSCRQMAFCPMLDDSKCNTHQTILAASLAVAILMRFEHFKLLSFR